MRISILRRRSSAFLWSIVAALLSGPCAKGQWSVVALHTPGAYQSRANAMSGSLVGGLLRLSQASQPLPVLWDLSGGPITVLAQTPQDGGGVFGMFGDTQVGLGGQASLWHGTAASQVNLQPPGLGGATPVAIYGDQQVGRVNFPTNFHAGLWHGTAASFVDLNPPGMLGSWANATDGVHQGGQVSLPGPNFGLHAALWSGTAASFVDLNPGPSFASEILGMVPGQQAGWAEDAAWGSRHAAVWSGTASSLIDFNPPGSAGSQINATTGAIQVGYWGLGGQLPRAGIWFGGPSSFLDLAQFLPAGYSQSNATAVAEVNGQVYVTGWATRIGGNDEAFVWVGVPAPATLAAMLGGLVLSLRRRRAGWNCAAVPSSTAPSA